MWSHPQWSNVRRPCIAQSTHYYCKWLHTYVQWTIWPLFGRRFLEWFFRSQWYVLQLPISCKTWLSTLTIRMLDFRTSKYAMLCYEIVPRWRDLSASLVEWLIDWLTGVSGNIYLYSQYPDPLLNSRNQACAARYHRSLHQHWADILVDLWVSDEGTHIETRKQAPMTSQHINSDSIKLTPSRQLLL